MPTWTKQPIHFIDFEGNTRSGILEYGIVTLCHGKVETCKTGLCAPLGRVREEEAAVHGLHEAELRGCRPFSENWDLFMRLREKGPFAAHCAGVENSLIKSVWPYPRLCPDFSYPGGEATEWGPWVDSAALCAQAFPSLGSTKLETLIAKLGLQAALEEHATRFCPPTRQRYHAALYDALAGALVLGHLAEDPSWGAMSVPQLLMLSTLSGEKRTRLQQNTLDLE